MAFATFSGGAPTVTFLRSDAFPRRYSVDDTQTILTTENGKVSAVSFSDDVTYIVLSWEEENFLPATNYIDLLAFTRHSAINFSANAFTFTDVDSTSQTVRYWGGLKAFQQITPTAYQGSITLRVEPV